MAYFLGNKIDCSLVERFLSYSTGMGTLGAAFGDLLGCLHWSFPRLETRICKRSPYELTDYWQLMSLILLRLPNSSLKNLSKADFMPFSLNLLMTLHHHRPQPLVPYSSCSKPSNTWNSNLFCHLGSVSMNVGLRLLDQDAQESNCDG